VNAQLKIKWEVPGVIQPSLYETGSQ